MTPLLLLVSLLAQLVNSGAISPRIISGTKTEPHEIPYQVFVIANFLMDVHWCSGSLLTNDYVLTTAHCVLGAREINVRLGVYDRTIVDNDTEVDISVIEYVPHPDYNDEIQNNNNIAVLRLSTPVETNQYIQFAPIVSRSGAKLDYVGKVGRYSGWGLPSYFNAVSPKTLMAANATIIAYEECKASFDTLLDSTYCTSSHGGTISYCNGDQGGPLVVDGVQIGFVSGGDPVCLWDGGEWPTIFTKIGDYADWIEENTDYVFRD